MRLGFFLPVAFILLLCAGMQQGCQPVDVRIVGRFELDADAGCGNCQEIGPLSMSFSGEESPGARPRYRLDYVDGQGHAGDYVFDRVDSTGLSLILYPDSAGPFFADLIGDVVISDYRVRNQCIAEPCGSGVRRCIWRKQ